MTGELSASVSETLSFDPTSGLLLRRTVVTKTPVGNLPEQIDYSDYRDVAGVKLPFLIKRATWEALDSFKVVDVGAERANRRRALPSRRCAMEARDADTPVERGTREQKCDRFSIAIGSGPDRMGRAADGAIGAWTTLRAVGSVSCRAQRPGVSGLRWPGRQRACWISGVDPQAWPAPRIQSTSPRVPRIRSGTRFVSFAEDFFRPPPRHLFLCVSSFNDRARHRDERPVRAGRVREGPGD
jgi:hypothetical protein